MGKLMLNNINYTGGSGGTNVVPNPPETATDDLTSIKIDNTVYNLAGGGNVYGAFIDTNRIIKNTTTVSSTTTYTATEDCIVAVTYSATSSSASSVGINGVTIFNSGGSNLTSSGMLYLKKSDTMTFTPAGAYNNYTVYGLTFGTQNIFTPQIYSTEERCVGVWTDNKPLYQKTIPFSNVSNSGTVSFGIANVDNIFLVSGKVSESSPLPYVHGSAPSNNVGGFFNISQADTGWSFRCGNDAPSTLSGWICVAYTKTTDTAGSGLYNILGVPTVHYTTDEQVVGTYLGKPLYQRVITPIVTASTTLAGDIKYGSFTLGDYINSVDMAFVDLSASYIEPATGVTRGLISAYYEKDSGNIVIVTMFTRTNSPSSLCIKYTKITD